MAETITCKKCKAPVVWADDIADMRDGVCGDCRDD